MSEPDERDPWRVRALEAMGEQLRRIARAAKTEQPPTEQPPAKQARAGQAPAEDPPAEQAPAKRLDERQDRLGEAR